MTILLPMFRHLIVELYNLVVDIFQSHVKLNYLHVYFYIAWLSSKWSSILRWDGWDDNFVPVTTPPLCCVILPKFLDGLFPLTGPSNCIHNFLIASLTGRSGPPSGPLFCCCTGCWNLGALKSTFGTWIFPSLAPLVLLWIPIPHRLFEDLNNFVKVFQDYFEVHFKYQYL